MTALLLACAQCASFDPDSTLRQWAVVGLVLSPFVIVGWTVVRLLSMERSGNEGT